MGANQDFDSKPIKVISIRRPESGSDGSLLSAIKKGSIPNLKTTLSIYDHGLDVEARRREASKLQNPF